MPDGLPLDVRQMAVVVLDALEVRHVREKVLRIDEKLVHVVEVGEDDLAPEEELVQGLGLGIYGLVGLVQLQQKTDAVRHLAAVYAVEEVVDRQGRGRMHGLVRPALPQDVAEILPEERGRPPVRKDEARVSYVRREIMRRDLFQERCHSVVVSSLQRQRYTLVLPKRCTKRPDFFQRYFFSRAVANDVGNAYLCI